MSGSSGGGAPSIGTEPAGSGAPVTEVFTRLIDDLRRLSEEDGAEITCDGLLALIGERSHALALFVFALLNLLPAPPGYNFVMGLIITIFAVLLTLRRPIRLWPLFGKRKLPLKIMVKLLDLLAWLVGIVAHKSVPRLIHFAGPAAIPLIGIFCTVMGLATLIPIPFTNTVPSIAVAMAAVGMLNRDGVLVLAAIVTGLAGLAFTVFAVWLVLALAFAVEDIVDGE